MTRTTEIRATYDDLTVLVYQAYGPHIAEPALAAGRFVPPFSRGRMTWVKPSFLWACYRSGWATKPGQERLLEVTLSRKGFEALLSRACLASFEAEVHGNRARFAEQLQTRPSRVQWDPERDVRLTALPEVRSLQLGIAVAHVPAYVDCWCLGLRDVTALAHEVRDTGDTALLPAAEAYPLDPDVAARLGTGPAA